MKLRKAVFPVAGFGTRFLPATKAMPKELLPIVDKPLIQYAAEEAIAAGIDTLIFVTGRNKRAIEDHFDANNELETILRAKGKDAQADMVRNIIPEGVEHATDVVYSNPIPHVLMLTAIVVGVATTALGLSLVVRIQEAYGTAEEDEIVQIDLEGAA